MTTGSAFLAAKFPLLVSVLWLLCLPAPVRATTVVDDDPWVIDVDGVLKASGTALHLPWPWPMIVGSPAVGALGWSSRDAMFGAGEARLKFSGRWHEDRLKWDIQARTGFFLFSEPNMVSAFSGGASSTAEPPRSLPFQYTDAVAQRRIWNAALDRLYFQTRLGPVDILVGRQPVSFGVGFIWQPADLLAPFSPLDIDKEFKPGVDAVRLNFNLGSFTELALVGVAGAPSCLHVSVPTAADPMAPSVWQTPSGKRCSPGEPRFERDASSLAARFRTTMGEFDLGALAGWVRGDWVVGVFTAGTLGRWKVRSEATFTWDYEDNEPGDADYSFRQRYIRAVAGVDYSFDFSRAVHVFSELHYNGFGTRNPDEYALILESARVAQYAEISALGQYYFGAGGVWELTEKLKWSALAMVNLTDPAAHFSTSVEILLSDETVLQIGGFLPVGRRPELLTAGGLPTGAALRSEFGMYPSMIFVLFKRYY
ncbi:hypothetical protein KKD52_17315 [Myxococcota bacterium]|nr:hypothetical protein [Myxococcota bacterium]MBU1411714.1 hypothetical protein [Myxococcota bacterium]MBU1512115.1 hypothetical protein [Myxococcota bacterium]